jgi:hypothetical protein
LRELSHFWRKTTMLFHASNVGNLTRQSLGLPKLESRIGRLLAG